MRYSTSAGVPVAGPDSIVTSYSPDAARQCLRGVTLIMAGEVAAPANPSLSPGRLAALFSRGDDGAEHLWTL